MLDRGNIGCPLITHKPLSQFAWSPTATHAMFDIWASYVQRVAVT